jgi:hypothetical protein
MFCSGALRALREVPGVKKDVRRPFARLRAGADRRYSRDSNPNWLDRIFLTENLRLL